MKRLKNRIIDTVINTFILEDTNSDDTLLFNLVPYFEYIAAFGIEFGENIPSKNDAEFTGDDLAKNNARFYEKYTLWGIHKMIM